MDKNQKKLKKLATYKANPEFAKYDEHMDTNDKLDDLVDAVKQPREVKITNTPNEIATAFWSMLRGDKGEKGDKGDQGEQGIQGIQGNVGPRGPKGIDGRVIQGIDGKDGKDGKDGVNGIDGLDGRDGKDGKDGKDGSPDTPKQIVDKLSQLKGNARLPSSAVQGFDDLEYRLANIPTHGGSNISAYANGMRVGSGSGIDISGTGVTATNDGSVTHYTISGSPAWGSITGTLSDQTDLQNALNAKENVANKATDLSSNDNTHYPTTAAVQAAIIAAEAGLLDYRGSYNASSNTFPSSGGSGTAGAILKGDTWMVSVPGTLGGTAVTAGDMVIATVDTPAQTASNWDLISHTLGFIPVPTTRSITINGATQDLSADQNWTITLPNPVSGINVYATANVSSTLGTYDKLSYTNDATTTTFSQTLTSGESLIKTFIYDTASGVTSIEAGPWNFNVYAKTTATSGTSYLRLEVFARTTGGVETTLFSQVSPNLTTSYAYYQFLSTQGQFTVNATDKIGVRVYADATGGASKTISFEVGDNTATFFNVPLPLRHDLLRDLGWSVSGHTGTANTLAAFDASGNATTVAQSTYQAALVSGTNIKTVGGNSVLGSGDLSSFTNNLTSPNFIDRLLSTAAAAGTTTLTVSSNYYQVFTGTTTQTIVLPVATTLTNGQSWSIINNSTGILTVNTSGGNLISYVSPGGSLIVSCINTAGGTGTASWSWVYTGPERIVTTTQSATPTIALGGGDTFSITGLAQAITSMTTNLTGIPVVGTWKMIQITDNGTARSITWGASFASTSNATLPTTTVISTRLNCWFRSTGSVMQLMAVT